MATKKFKENSLYYYANKYRQELIEEEDLDKEDATDLFLGELDAMIKNGELVIININAKMRLGKSTLAMAIAQDIVWPLLKKYKYRKKNEKFGMKNIARDHQEHSKMMRDPETCFTVIVTDESNALENTGENSTTERALEQVFSDVQAGRYVHRVCCSPKETVDPNADILLSVTAIDPKSMMTHAKLYYRFYEGGNEYTQLIGYVRLSVKNVIKKWVNVGKKLFYKIQRNDYTQEDIDKLNKLIKTDWYTAYYVKKHEKMELITKEGILRPRTLDYASLILNVVNSLKKLTKAGNILNKNVVKNYMKAEFDKGKIPYSILGLELATNEAMGVLDIYKSYWATQKRINTMQKKVDKGDVSAISEVADLEEMRNTLREVAETQMKELNRYEDVNRRYNNDEVDIYGEKKNEKSK